MATATFSSLRLELKAETSQGVTTHYTGRAIGTLVLHISASEIAGNTVRLALLCDAIPYDGIMGEERPSGEWNSTTLPTTILTLRDLNPGENVVSFATETTEFSLERLREDISSKPVEQEWGVQGTVYVLNRIGEGHTRPSELNRELKL